MIASPPDSVNPDRPDIAVVGAGAAGLMAAIQAGRFVRESGTPRQIVLLDGAGRLGAKILISGGGRCNVTHHAVDETAFAGSTPPAIRKVLRRFGVEETIRFFQELGVSLKREETGKLFPVSDDARTVLDALLAAARDVGVEIRPRWRVEAIVRDGGAFRLRAGAPRGAGIRGKPGNQPRPADLLATRVILATGGRSVPRTGSDGGGYEIARSLGHTLTERIFPALVPLILPSDHPLTRLAGVSAPAWVRVRGGTGKSIARFTGSVLCTHFGLSGPAILDASRYYLDAHTDDPGTELRIDWLPASSREDLDVALRAGGKGTVWRVLGRDLPDRLARSLARLAGVDPVTPLSGLTREMRGAVLEAATDLAVPITGTRGFRVAEVTAGGVPLSELDLKTLESRMCPGLHLCGEICDVDGRIGGFNFQWAWASGHVAGRSAARIAD